MTDVDRNDPLTNPTIYRENADIGHLNSMLDMLTSKRFVSPSLAIATFRAALDFHGITLPHLEIEGANGPTNEYGPAIITGKTAATAPDRGREHEAEYLFKITDPDESRDKEQNRKDDPDNFYYLYIIIEHDDKVGLWDAYAQVITNDELDMIADMRDYVTDKDYPELEGDVGGETEYERQQRHASAGGGEQPVASSTNPGN